MSGTGKTPGQAARDALRLDGLMPMGLHFDDADPVARCLVGNCQWHGHGDSMNDAVIGWTGHLARDHRGDWPDDDETPAIATAGTEHLLDPGDPDSPRWQPVPSRPAEAG